MTAIGFCLILHSVLIFEGAWAHPFAQDSAGERTRIGTVYSNRHFEYQVLESMWDSQLYELASQHCQAQQRNYAPGQIRWPYGRSGSSKGFIVKRRKIDQSRQSVLNKPRESRSDS